MTATIRSITVNSTATLQAWGTAFHAALVSVGMVQTSDTGQINWSTVTLTGGTSSIGYQGYEVWAFSDSLQSTVPCYIKIWYALTQSNGMVLQFSCGVATDGAGNMTSNHIDTSYYAFDSFNASTYYLSGNTNRLAIAVNSTPGDYVSLWSIERSHDASGNDTTNFISFMAASLAGSGGPGGSMNSTQQAYNASIPPAGQSIIENQSQKGLPCLINSNSTSSAFGNNVYVSPYYPFVYEVQNPNKNFLVYYTTDFIALTPTSISIYGAVHTYLPLGSGLKELTYIERSGTNTGSQLSPFILWE